ncbi:hypothetical protein KQ878_02275 [Mycoplasma zalophidermidis]|uniref:DUF2357 domain-containing protein n=1 Tax=Mycoplasma zalophidermidis TaxID=398174 RepID=A0ABS6DRR2_9MOLU|nr:hypothetical protein [Mycoplasma zalophidermidis]MBU4693699.1 hypothetical protein [Mycoplasma zalophidermidis]
MNQNELTEVLFMENTKINLKIKIPYSKCVIEFKTSTRQNLTSNDFCLLLPLLFSEHTNDNLEKYWDVAVKHYSWNEKYKDFVEKGLRNLVLEETFKNKEKFDNVQKITDMLCCDLEIRNEIVEWINKNEFYKLKVNKKLDQEEYFGNYFTKLPCDSSIINNKQKKFQKGERPESEIISDSSYTIDEKIFRQQCEIKLEEDYKRINSHSFIVEKNASIVDGMYYNEIILPVDLRFNQDGILVESNSKIYMSLSEYYPVYLEKQFSEYIHNTFSLEITTKNKSKDVLCFRRLVDKWKNIQDLINRKRLCFDGHQYTFDEKGIYHFVNVICPFKIGDTKIDFKLIGLQEADINVFLEDIYKNDNFQKFGDFKTYDWKDKVQSFIETKISKDKDLYKNSTNFQNAVKLLKMYSDEINYSEILNIKEFEELISDIDIFTKSKDIVLSLIPSNNNLNIASPIWKYLYENDNRLFDDLLDKYSFNQVSSEKKFKTKLKFIYDDLNDLDKKCVLLNKKINDLKTNEYINGDITKDYEKIEKDVEKFNKKSKHFCVSVNFNELKEAFETRKKSDKDICYNNLQSRAVKLRNKTSDAINDDIKKEMSKLPI